MSAPSSELVEAYNMAQRAAIAAREVEQAALTALARSRAAVSEAENSVAMITAVIRNTVPTTTKEV